MKYIISGKAKLLRIVDELAKINHDDSFELYEIVRNNLQIFENYENDIDWQEGRKSLYDVCHYLYIHTSMSRLLFSKISKYYLS